MTLPVNQLSAFDLLHESERVWQGERSTDYEFDDIIDAPVAVVADIATSLFNSFVPESMESGTMDILSKAGLNDAADFYANHRTGVQLASFVGGLFVPGVLVAKGLKIAKAGGATIFGTKTVGRAFQTVYDNKGAARAEALRLLEGSGVMTDQYIRARRSWRNLALAEGAMEGATFEVALLGMYNGHVYMDEYDKTDFVIGTLLGTVFAPIRYIWDNRKFKLRAAELESGVAQAGDLSLYKSRLGIIGTSGDRVSAVGANLESTQTAMEGRDWTGKSASLDFAQRDQIRIKGQLVEEVTKMMDPSVQAATRRQSEPGVAAGIETDINKMTPADHLIQLTTGERKQSLAGAERVSFFDSQSAPGFEPAAVSDYTYTLVAGKELKNAPEVAIEAFEGGSAVSAWQMLTRGRKPTRRPDELVGGLEEAGIAPANWRSIFDGPNFVEDTRILFDEDHAGVTITIMNNDANLARVDSLTNRFVRDALTLIHLDKGFRNVDIVVKHTELGKEAGGALKGLYDKGRKSSKKVAQFVAEDIRNSSATPEMIAGTRTVNPRQVFALVDGDVGFVPTAERIRRTGKTRVQPSVLGYRDMADIPHANQKDFALVELPKGARIATFKDLEQLSPAFRRATTKEGRELFEEGLDLTNPATITSPEAQQFLQLAGFSGAEIAISSSTKRYAKAAGTILFSSADDLTKAPRIKRRFDADHVKATRQYRESQGLPNFNPGDEVAVYDSRTKSIIAGSQAMIIQGAADIAGGYKVDIKFSMSGPVSDRARPFKPYEHNTIEADRQYLDALHSIARSKPKQMTINFDDLPALNAAFVSGLGDRVKLVMPEGVGPIQDMTQAKLAQHLLREKTNYARALSRSGYGIEQIALYTNMPASSVEKLVSAGFDTGKLLQGDSAMRDFLNYTSTNKKELSSYTVPRQMQFTGKPASAQNMINQRQYTSIDAQIAQNTHRAIIENESLMAAAKVPFIGDMFGMVTSPGFRQLIKHAVNFASKEVLGNPTINSRDFALRKLNEQGVGDLGDAIVQHGQDFDRGVTSLVEETNKSLHASFENISKDPAALVQFNDIDKSLLKIPTSVQRKMQFDPESGQFVLSRNKETGEITSALAYVREGKFTDEPIIVKNADLNNHFAEVWQPIQDMLYTMKEVNHKMVGNPAPGALGVWHPFANLQEANIAYIFDGQNVAKARQIIGTSVPDLESQIAKIRAEIDPDLQIVRRADADDWNKITSYTQLNDLERADSSLKRSGIIQEATAADTRVMQRILQGVSGEIWKNARQYQRIAGAELFDNLDRYTKFHKSPQVSNAGTFSQKASKQISTSEVVAKTLLGQNLINDSHLLSTVNNQYSWMIETATDKLNTVWDDVWRSTKGDLSQAKHEEISTALEEAGVPNPWKGWEDFVTDNPAWKRPDAKNLIAKMNNLLVTFNLRLFEMAHGAITTFSIPIVIGAELGQRDYGLRYMYEGVRALFDQSDKWKQIRKVAADKGYSRGRVAENVTNAINSSMIDPGVLSKIEDNKVFQLLTLPSDAAEKLSRQLAYLTGYKLGISKYGENASEQLLETFANQFTNRTMGNYTARQRPTMFQGALGATFGLYQTFMLSMFQQTFKFLEKGEFGALRNLVSAQSGMFGIQTLPLFAPINKAIGAYTNDDNSDVVTTAYSVFGNTDDNSRSMAEYILYGLPSTLFQSAFYTRGELQPRPPIDIFAPIEEGQVAVAPPLVNTLKQLWDFSWDTGTQVGQALQNGGSPIDAARAIAEGISLQSMWRPGARLAELITGHSLDRAGRIVSAESEASANWATFARVMAVRPLQEQVARNLNFSARYYDGKDQENRKVAVRSLRSMIATGNKEAMGPTFQSYLDNGGTAKGWKSVLNDAYLQANQNIALRLADEFRERREISDILRSYNN